jgi:uncharacterized protein YbjT (DUF2867 family)
MRMLVTGATGLVGSRLLARWIEVDLDRGLRAVAESFLARSGTGK